MSKEYRRRKSELSDARSRLRNRLITVHRNLDELRTNDMIAAVNQDVNLNLAMSLVGEAIDNLPTITPTRNETLVG